MNERDLCAQAVNRWGYKKQLGMVIEEASELIQAVCKVLRNDIDPSQTNTNVIANLAEETADMEIMCEQVRMMIGDEIVDREKCRKLDKLAGLLGQSESRPLDTQVLETDRREINELKFRVQRLEWQVTTIAKFV